MTAWNEFVIQFARKHKMTYGCALTDPNCSAAYHQSKAKRNTKKKSKPIAVEVEPLVEAEPQLKPKGLKINRVEKLVEAEPSLKPKNITIQKKVSAPVDKVTPKIRGYLITLFKKDFITDYEMLKAFLDNTDKLIVESGSTKKSKMIELAEEEFEEAKKRLEDVVHHLSKVITLSDDDFVIAHTLPDLLGSLGFDKVGKNFVFEKEEDEADVDDIKYFTNILKSIKADAKSGLRNIRRITDKY